MLRRLMPLAFALTLVACEGGDGGTDAGGVDAGTPDAGALGFFSCDPRQVTCDAEPPMCMTGFIAIVEGGCWGMCGQAAGCRPIECEMATAMEDCPPTWTCVLGNCRPPR